MKGVVSLYFLFFITTNSNAQNISIDEFYEELELVKNLIKDLHPDPYVYTSEEEFSVKSKFFKEEVSSKDSVLTLNAFTYYARLVSSTRCAHSGAFYQKF